MVSRGIYALCIRTSVSNAARRLCRILDRVSKRDPILLRQRPGTLINVPSSELWAVLKPGLMTQLIQVLTRGIIFNKKKIKETNMHYGECMPLNGDPNGESLLWKAHLAMREKGEAGSKNSSGATGSSSNMHGTYPEGPPSDINPSKRARVD